MRAFIAGTLLAFALTGIPAHAADENGYHGPSDKPRWLTTPCAFEDGNNCYWNAGTSGDGGGHSFWSIPVGPNKLAIVYWNPQYNRDHGFITPR